MSDNLKTQDKPKAELDEIPEGGLSDIMKILGPLLKKYTRLRIYKLFSLIPKYLRYAFWSWVGGIIWKIPPTQKIIQNGIESYKSIFPKKSLKDILILSKNHWRLLGYGFFSLLMVDIPNWTPENIDKFVEFQGLEHLDKALERGKGVIIAGTHVGLLPTMYVALALKGYKTNLIANVKVSGALVAVRPIPGIRCIPTGTLSKLKPKLHYVLKENELLFIFADFSQRKQMGIKFLGKLGHTPAGIPVLAKETGAAIIPAFTFPRTLSKMVVKFQPEHVLIERPNMSKKEFIGENMLKLNDLMTWLIRRAPIIYFEHTSYEMLKTYRRKEKVSNADSREVGFALVRLAKQLLDTTYEKGRDDIEYYEQLEKYRIELVNVPDDQISDKRFEIEFVIKWHHVRVSLLRICREAIDMKIDHSVVKIIFKAMQELVIAPI
jgi:lauroyl/myristoyl acyltransferase